MIINAEFCFNHGDVVKRVNCRRACDAMEVEHAPQHSYQQIAERLITAIRAEQAAGRLSATARLITAPEDLPL